MTDAWHAADRGWRATARVDAPAPAGRIAPIMRPTDAPILVTGGASFVGSHCIARLLAAGFRVRATVRSPIRAAVLRSALDALGVTVAATRLEIVYADLLADDGWTEAAAGCPGALHVASPLPLAQPGDEDELIQPARGGTLRVLRAARAAGMQRVVVTSSFAAIGYGHDSLPPSYDETCWTDPAAPVSAYVRAKTLAERAAWDYVAATPGAPALVSVNPVAILGPIPLAETSASVELVRRLLAGRVPACPRLWFGVVDIRDVADLHLLALTRPEAAGQRFLCSADTGLSLLEMARMLADHLPALRRRLPTRTLPDWLVRGAALAAPSLRPLLPELGRRKSMSSRKAREWLGWTPRSSAEAIRATADSLVRLGQIVLPPPRHGKDR